MKNSAICSIRSSVAILALFVAIAAHSQISQGGQPDGWGQAMDLRSTALLDLNAPPQRLVQSVIDDAATGTSFSYGFQRFIAADVLGQGTWYSQNGLDICRFRLRSPGASMLSVQFDDLFLAPGAKVFLFSAKHHKFIGSFTDANMNPSGGLATAVIPGEEVVIEYQAPANNAGISRLHVASITHGVRNIFNFPDVGQGERDYYPGYPSAPCHNNVACSIASAWQAQASSVAMFLRADGGGCTGTMINNTAQDGKPYFYLANHCNVASYAQWVFYFNYAAPQCVGDTGRTDQTVSGCTLRSAFYYSDLALVELFNQPPASYNVYYAGWDRSNAQPSSTAAIMHPLYDVKKIVFDFQAPTTSFGGYGTDVWNTDWDDGLIEAVGSGCALFDQNKRIIGNMTDADGSCADLGFGVCTKISEQWNGTAANNRLRDWLDPGNTGATVLNGGYMNSPPPTISVQLKAFLAGPYSQSTGLMGDQLRSILPTTEPFTALGFTHVGEGGGEAFNATLLNTTGSTAIVDWVFLELRNKNAPTNIMSTKSALIRRDGRIVAMDGASNVSIGLAPDNYYIAVKHRNHLGIMTLTSKALSSSATLIDLTNGTTILYGTQATRTIGSVQAMWEGDVTRDALIRYTGSGNDRDPVLQLVGGSVPTNVVSGYHVEDVNMNGEVKYTGTNNDRDPMLVNIGGSQPTLTRAAQLP